MKNALRQRMERTRLMILLLAITGIACIVLMAYQTSSASFSSKIAKAAKDTSQFQDGDIIFQSSKSGQSLAIQIATESKYSHVGILFKQDGEWQVLEAVQPVKVTSFEKWITHGDDQHYVVKRLKNSDKLLTPKVLSEMRKLGKSFVGKDYDLYFGWSDDLMYCSELVWKLFDRCAGVSVGELQKFKEFRFDHPEVKKILRQRYGDRLPMEETVISPGAIFNNPGLIEVQRSK